MHKSSRHSNKGCVGNEDAPTVISCAHFLDKRGLWTSSPQALFVSHRQCIGRKGRKMKIRILYDNKPTYLEVQDEDCTVMIDADYEGRLSSAKDNETVIRRSVQEIMDEHFNKPEYNNWHKFCRHRGMPKKPFRKDVEATDEFDPMDYFPDNSDEEMREKKAEYEYMCDIIRKSLKEKQVELLIAIILDEVSVSEYAQREGVTVSAISHRIKIAKKNFKKAFPNPQLTPLHKANR